MAMTWCQSLWVVLARHTMALPMCFLNHPSLPSLANTGLRGSAPRGVLWTSQQGPAAQGTQTFPAAWIQTVLVPTSRRTCPLLPRDTEVRGMFVYCTCSGLLICWSLADDFSLLTWRLEIKAGHEWRIDTRGVLSWSVLSSLSSHLFLLCQIDLYSRLWRTIPFNLKCSMLQGCLCCPCKEAVFLRHSLAEGTGGVEEACHLYSSPS